MKQKQALRNLVIGLVVFALLFTVFPAVTSSGQTVTANFPYIYGTPTVPSDVGAQGIQGPTISTANMTPTATSSVVGYHGNLFTFPKIASTLDVQVKNGTVTSSAIGSEVSVALENVSNGNWTSELTNSEGYANISLYEGWYDLYINSSSSSFLSFVQKLDVQGSSAQLLRYLIPSSYTDVTVGNGPAASNTLTYTVNVNPGWQYAGAPGLAVDLYNKSGGSSVIATSITNHSGVAVFSSVNSGYSYAVAMVSTNPYSGFNYEMPASSQTTLTTGSNQTVGIQTYSNNVWTSTVTGTAPSTSSWKIQANTTVTGGIFDLGQISSGTGSFTLDFNNLTLLLNSSHLNYYFFPTNVKVTLDNITLISLADWESYDYQYITVKNSTVFLYASTVYQAYEQKSLSGYFFNAVNSQFTIGMKSNDIPTIWSGNFTDSYITESILNESTGMQIQNLSLVNSTIFNFANFGAHSSSTTFHQWFVGSFTCNFTDSEDATSTLISNSVMNNFSIIQSYTPSSLVNDYYNNSWLNFSFPYNQPVVFSRGTMGFGISTVTELSNYQGNYTRDFISFVLPYKLTWSTYYAKWQAEYIAAHREVSYRLEHNSNISFSTIYAQTYPRLNITLATDSTTTFDGTLSMYEDQVLQNYTTAQLDTWNLSAPMPGRFAIGADKFNASRTLFLEGNFMGMQPNVYGNFTNDSFPFFIWANSIVPFSIDNANIGGFKGVVNFENNYVGIIDTYSRYYPNVNEMYGAVSFAFIIDANSAPPYPEPNMTVNVYHNTFAGAPTGVYTGFAPEWIGSNEYNATYNIGYNIFFNRPGGGPNPTYVAPYGMDINAQSGNLTIDHNYFLNLNNKTVPIGYNDAMGFDNTPYGIFAPNVTLVDNHFFYNPSIFQESIPVNPSPLPYQTANNTTYVADNTTTPSQSFVTYYIPAVIQTHLDLSSQTGQLVFNSTIYQHNSVPYPWNQHMQPTYAYSVCPDVNTSSGTPVISYANGLVGGPQPNFIWKGYNYSEWVEPNAFKIGVNSSKAPSVILQFTGLEKGLAYTFTESDNGTYMSSYTFLANGSTYNYTYDPAKDPLDPIYTITVYSPNGPSGPPDPAPVTSVNQFIQDLKWFFEQPWGIGVFVSLPVIAAIMLYRRRYDQQ